MINVETLRAAIEASLQERHSTSRAAVEVQEHGVSQWRAVVRLHGDALGDVVRSRVSDAEADALRALALACGLCPDGSDPLVELARVRGERDAAWAALRAYGPSCDGCGGVATRRRLHRGSGLVCDRAECVERAGFRGDALTDLSHAAALRAAGGAR